MDMPVLRPRADGKYELAERFGYVPKGFVTDGASIPRFLWRVCGHPYEAPQIAAAIYHDYHYATGVLPRYSADLFFRVMLEDCGVGFVRRWIFYFAVRLFGWRHYNKKEKLK